jgi:hypothetical protein
MTNTPTKTIHTIDALTLEKLLRKGDVLSLMSGNSTSIELKKLKVQNYFLFPLLIQKSYRLKGINPLCLPVEVLIVQDKLPNVY